MMEYNTTRSNLILREYGRNFHKLVDYVGNIKSKEERNKMSKTLVEMMKLTHPSFKDQNEIDSHIEHIERENKKLDKISRMRELENWLNYLGLE